ncbi:MAG: hypothetical protein AAF823_05355 [Planctomycetota bacterium]
MLIAGSRVKRTLRGRVADYCHACGDVRPMLVYDETVYPHIYFVPLGREVPAGSVAVCETCGAELRVDPYRYADFSKDVSLPLDALSGQTHPALSRKIAEHRTFVKRVEAGTASMSEKARWMLDVLSPIEQAAEVRGEKLRVDGMAMLSMGVTAIGFVGAILVGAGVLGWSWPVWLGVAAGVLLVGAGVCGWLVMTDVARFARGQVREAAYVLTEAQATDAELFGLVESMKAKHGRLAGCVSARWLSRLLREADEADESGDDASGEGPTAA